MSRFLEDMLCGLLGYGIGKRRREFTQNEVVDLIRSLLQGVPLEAVINYCMEANGFEINSPSIARRLRDKAEDMDW